MWVPVEMTMWVPVGKIEKDTLESHEKREIDIDKKRFTWIDRDSDRRRQTNIEKDRHE